MEDSSLLLLFDKNRPCWSESLVGLAGEDPGGLGRLEREALLERTPNGGYVLTPGGRERFARLAAESFLDSTPGEPPQDPGLSLFALEAILRLDQGFHSPWGSKDPQAGILLPYYPALPPCSNFDELEALERHPLRLSFAGEFPRGGNDLPAPSEERLLQWAGRTGALRGALPLDVLFIHRYDYRYYIEASAPGDSLKLLNTDRLLVRLAEPSRLEPGPFIERTAQDLSRLRPFLEYARRVLLPGRFDTDTQEQSSVTWWVWITRTEAEAALLSGWLAPVSDRLIGPSAPLDFWVVSLEALGSSPERHETFYELFEEKGLSVARTA